MKKVFLLIVAGMLVVASTQLSLAGDNDEKGSPKGSMHEEKGSDHEHSPKMTKEDMQAVMEKYITEKAAGNDGVFELKEEESGKVRRLSYIDLHEGLGMKNGKHFSCADFKDLDSGEVLDVDIYVDATDEGLAVTDAVIHKVDGTPLKASEKGSEKEEEKGSDYEKKGS